MSDRFEHDAAGLVNGRYGDARTGGIAVHLLGLGVFTAVFLAGTVQVLRRRTTPC